MIKSLWSTHHALKRRIATYPELRIKLTYFKLLKTVLSWPTEDPDFEPDYSLLERQCIIFFEKFKYISPTAAIH